MIYSDVFIHGASRIPPRMRWVARVQGNTFVCECSCQVWMPSVVSSVVSSFPHVVAYGLQTELTHSAWLVHRTEASHMVVDSHAPTSHRAWKWN